MYDYKDDEKCHHRDHYDTAKEAKRAAGQMGLQGCHSTDCNGKTVYMPGETHADYMDYQEGMGGDSPVDPGVFGFE